MQNISVVVDYGELIVTKPVNDIIVFSVWPHIRTRYYQWYFRTFQEADGGNGKCE